MNIIICCDSLNGPDGILELTERTVEPLSNNKLNIHINRLMVL